MVEHPTTALSQAVLDEVCQTLPRKGSGAGLASEIVEAAKTDETTPKLLRHIGRKALARASIMWR
ncbi:hypothetical protein [Bradyrhizobium sp. WSM471]|uniref:hypothetical protein n=1 Tax=Bradyrhizobium sp. WSM471 TaxID=319017 RepID=UPI00024D36AC|nr:MULTISPECIES: hypothetical protein [Bradyrhizobium]EHR05606.1 hypothetical protein Bra471DRAFT_06429 [Bradyrhizobium sp. WSM471]UFW40702.1 hypothetical protein BcanWSM471_31565 [Bradyrhizobium canariense]